MGIFKKNTKTEDDKFNELLDEVHALEKKKESKKAYDELIKKKNELKYGDLKVKGGQVGNFVSDGFKGLGEMIKSFTKDESRLEVRRVVEPIIVKLFKDLEECKIIETHEQLVLDPIKYTKVKARYYPAGGKK